VANYSNESLRNDLKNFCSNPELLSNFWKEVENKLILASEQDSDEEEKDTQAKNKVPEVPEKTKAAKPLSKEEKETAAEPPAAPSPKEQANQEPKEAEKKKETPEEKRVNKEEPLPSGKEAETKAGPLPSEKYYPDHVTPATEWLEFHLLIQDAYSLPLEV